MSSEHLNASHLGSVLVLGLGATGRSVVRYCAPLIGGRIDRLTVAAGDYSPEAEAFMAPYRGEGLELLFDTQSFSASYDLCIASPGISQFSPFYENAAHASGELISEVEFAWRESDPDSRWVAVTGTNGKTTTTALINHLLQAGGDASQAVGNIGDCCIDAVASQALDDYVAEVSSYQLASCRRFVPEAAVLLNITPDHLSWHHGFEAYAQAKLSLFARLGVHPGSVGVFDASDPQAYERVMSLADEIPALRSQLVAIGGPEGVGQDLAPSQGLHGSAFLEDSRLMLRLDDRRIELITRDELLLKGDHNIINALAAAAVAASMGVEPSALRRGLASFAPLPHRIEPVGSVEGVRCYNDSKATNVDATLKALDAFKDEPLVLLLGGCDKGTELDDLAAAVGAGSVRAVVCFGDAGGRFFDAMGASGVERLRAGSLAAALKEGLAVAEAGDSLLLSPACSSFDEFSGFEERGDRFKALVGELRDKRGA